MLQNGTISLAAQFAELEFAKMADDWLSSIQPRKLMKQFRSRKIVEVHSQDHRGGLKIREDGMFCLWISAVFQCPGTIAYVIGNELAQTFLYDLAHAPPLRCFTHESEQVSQFRYEFSKRWIDRNDSHYMTQAVQNQLSTIRGFNFFVPEEAFH